MLIGVGCLEDGYVGYYDFVGGGRLGVEIKNEAIAGDKNNRFV